MTPTPRISSTISFRRPLVDLPHALHRRLALLRQRRTRLRRVPARVPPKASLAETVEAVEEKMRGDGNPFFALWIEDAELLQRW